MRPIKAVWGMVSYGPFPYAPVYTSHMTAIAYASRHFTTQFLDGSKIAGVGATDRSYTHAAENRIVSDFLAIEDATHLFMTEMDMVLPTETLVQLADLNQPIASGLYFLRGGNGAPCLYVKGYPAPENPYTHSLVTVFPTDKPFKLGDKGGCPGLGCVLIAREVFETIPFPWFDLKEKGYGSDMYFYTKALEAGYEVWVDPRVRCGQMDYIAYTFEDYEKRVKEEPRFLGAGFLLGTERTPA